MGVLGRANEFGTVAARQLYLFIIILFYCCLYTFPHLYSSFLFIVYTLYLFFSCRKISYWNVVCTAVNSDSTRARNRGQQATDYGTSNAADCR